MIGKRSILLSFVKDKEKSGEASIIQPPPADVEKIISGAITYAQQVRGKDPKYVKYPAGWIRAAGYDDEVIPLARASGGWQPYRDPDESEYFEPMFPDLERTESP